MHAGHELTGRERLGDVIVRTEFEAEHPVHFVVAGTQYQDRDVRGDAPPATSGSPFCPAPAVATRRCRAAPESSADVETVEGAGQPDVHDDQLRMLAFHQGQARLSVFRLEHPETVTPQVHSDQVRYVVIVLDHHQGLLGRHHEIQPATGPAVPAVMVRKV